MLVPAPCSDLQERLELGSGLLETHHLQLGAGEDFAFVAPVDGAGQWRVMGLQDESAEPTTDTWFNLLVITVFEDKTTGKRIFQSVCFAFSTFQGPVPSCVCYHRIVPQNTAKKLLKIFCRTKPEILVLIPALLPGCCDPESAV